VLLIRLFRGPAIGVSDVTAWMAHVQRIPQGFWFGLVRFLLRDLLPSHPAVEHPGEAHVGGYSREKSSMIEFKDVHKWFGELHVLKGIHLKVDPAEVMVVCGPSGSARAPSSAASTG